MLWKQRIFRIIGLISFAGGFYAFYDYGSNLLPLFTQFVASTPLDVFEVFTTATSFFLGTLALVWVGVRLMTLRSFGNTWLYYALLPIIAWLVELYNVGLLFSMDKILSQSVLYLCLYVLILKMVVFVHTHWFMPVSHESMGHVGLEKSGAMVSTNIRLLLVCIALGVLLILHPSDIATTLRMVASPFTYLLSLW